MDDADGDDADAAGPSGRPSSQHGSFAAVAPAQLLGPPRLPQPLPSGVSWGLLAVPHKVTNQPTLTLALTLTLSQAVFIPTTRARDGRCLDRTQGTRPSFCLARAHSHRHVRGL